MIEVPAKIQRLNVVNKYITPEYHGNDIDDILDYAQYGDCIYKNELEWTDNSTRTDIIKYDEAVHWAELENNPHFDDSIDDATKYSITSIIKKCWDSFALIGAKRTILVYEFGIDTGGARTVY